MVKFLYWIMTWFRLQFRWVEMLNGWHPVECQPLRLKEEVQG